MRLIIPLFTLMILTTITFVVYALYFGLKDTIYRKYLIIKNTFLQYIHFIKFMIIFSYTLVMNTIKEPYSIFAILVFTAFECSYKYRYTGYENWAYDERLFPQGKSDLTNLYIWITQTRKLNYSIYESLEFDKVSNTFTYYDAKYQGFQFTLDSTYRVIIKPLEFVEGDKRLEFEKTKLRLFNTLKNLDTKKCIWLLERRGSLGL